LWPQPVQVQTEQHAGLVISMGLHNQHETQHHAECQPAQQTPQKFHQQQSHIIHWHMFPDLLLDIIMGDININNIEISKLETDFIYYAY
jgi:hypothetical protein